MHSVSRDAALEIPGSDRESKWNDVSDHPYNMLVFALVHPLSSLALIFGHTGRQQ